MDLVAGTSEDVWFTGVDVEQRTVLGNIDVRGAVHEIVVGTGLGYPGDITMDPGGGIWFVAGDTVIGRVSRARATPELFFLEEAQGSRALGIGASDEDVCVTLQEAARVVCLDYRGVQRSEFDLTQGALPFDLIRASDGTSWLAEPGIGRLAHLRGSAEIEEFEVAGTPARLARHPAGSGVCYTNPPDRIGCLDLSGIVEYSVPTPNAEVFDIVLSDNTLWATETLAGNLVAMSADGEFREVGVGGYPSRIASGSRGDLWFTDAFSNTITHVLVGESNSCPGDCSEDGTVDVAELIGCIGEALGSENHHGCAACDVNNDARVTVSELVASVQRALDGCAHRMNH